MAQKAAFEIFLLFRIPLEQNGCNFICLLPNLDGREGSAIYHHHVVKKSLSGVAAFIIVIMHGERKQCCAWGWSLCAEFHKRFAASPRVAAEAALQRSHSIVCWGVARHDASQGEGSPDG